MAAFSGFSMRRYNLRRQTHTESRNIRAHRQRRPVTAAEPENTVIGGNSSLTLMYQTVEFALNYGFRGQPW
ncbi:MAG: hypothetical protein O7F73_03690 [Gammaproteobacteria bacterium]|nr:hypothetical protein [Gammaproteobacteria bacterium]